MVVVFDGGWRLARNVTVCCRRVNHIGHKYLESFNGTEYYLLSRNVLGGLLDVITYVTSGDGGLRLLV